jgi:hypothetical protein
MLQRQCEDINYSGVDLHVEGFLHVIMQHLFLLLGLFDLCLQLHQPLLPSRPLCSFLRLSVLLPLRQGQLGRDTGCDVAECRADFESEVRGSMSDWSKRRGGH